MKIVLDPGHGGKDPGAVDLVNQAEGDQIATQEDDLTFTLALMLQSFLLRDGHKVLMTRKHLDDFIELADRVQLANSSKADVFISLHMNAATNTGARGIEVLYHTAGEELAKVIQDELVKSLGAVDRGTRQRKGIYVLKNTEMPAVLVELGFITNPGEEVKLNSILYLTTAARAITRAVKLYEREGKVK